MKTFSATSLLLLALFTTTAEAQRTGGSFGSSSWGNSSSSARSTTSPSRSASGSYRPSTPSVRLQRVRVVETIANRPTRTMARPAWVDNHTSGHRFDHRAPLLVVHDRGNVGDEGPSPVGEADPLVCGVVSIAVLGTLGCALLYGWWTERKRRALRIQRRDRFGY